MFTPGYISDEAFNVLGHIVAEGRLVVLTGAGISVGLENTNSQLAPSWWQILDAVRNNMIASGALIPDSDEAKTINMALDKGVIGRHSILAATLLLKCDSRLPETSRVFMKTIRECLELKSVSEQPPNVIESKKKLLNSCLALEPLGFVTFNVDQGHELLLNELGVDFEVADPLNDQVGAESILRKVLRGEQDKKFLVKAHGSISPPGLSTFGKIAFTHLQYRELLASSPIYRAFMSNMLSNYNLLSVGFGMTDLDFDIFRDDLINQFGGPIRQHVALEVVISDAEARDKPSKQVALINSSELKALTDIHTLFVDNHGQYTDVLIDVASRPGKLVSQWIDQCVDEDDRVRRSAHENIRSLGEVGKLMIAKMLEEKITDLLSDTSKHSGLELAEYSYTIGNMQPKSSKTKELVKKIIFKVVRECTVKEPIAHAICVSQPYLSCDDLPELYALGEDLKSRGLFSYSEDSEPDDRLPVFLENIILRVRARDLRHINCQDTHQSFVALRT